jgi:hypothetical protein
MYGFELELEDGSLIHFIPTESDFEADAVHSEGKGVVHEWDGPFEKDCHSEEDNAGKKTIRNHSGRSVDANEEEDDDDDDDEFDDDDLMAASDAEWTFGDRMIVEFNQLSPEAIESWEVIRPPTKRDKRKKKRGKKRQRKLKGTVVGMHPVCTHHHPCPFMCLGASF